MTYPECKTCIYNDSNYNICGPCERSLNGRCNYIPQTGISVQADTTPSAPREFWIRKDYYSKGVLHPFDDAFCSELDIHVIEYSAVESLRAENKKLEAKLIALAQDTRLEIDELKQENEKLKELVRDALNKKLVVCICENEEQCEGCSGYKWREKAQEVLK